MRTINNYNFPEPIMFIFFITCFFIYWSEQHRQKRPLVVTSTIKIIYKFVLFRFIILHCVIWIFSRILKVGRLCLRQVINAYCSCRYEPIVCMKKVIGGCTINISVFNFFSFIRVWNLKYRTHSTITTWVENKSVPQMVITDFVNRHLTVLHSEKTIFKLPLCW